MNLIHENYDELLKYTDFEYYDKYNIERIFQYNITGFIMISKNTGKYTIEGIILYKYDKISGSRTIFLLFGKYVKLRGKLIMAVVNHLRETNPYNTLTIYSDSYSETYDNEDLHVYLDLGFKFSNAVPNFEGKPLYVTYVYREN